MTAIAPVTDKTDHALRTIEGVEDAYSYHVSTFTTWLRERARPLDFEAVADYFRDLNDSHYSAGTKRIKRQAIKNRLRLLSDHEGLTLEMQYQFDRAMKRLDTDPATKAPKLNTSAVGGSKIVSEDEYNRLILKARSPKQTLFLRFLWQTGCRVSELCGAKLRDCKREGPVVQIRVLGKGRKERVVKITGELFDATRSEFRSEEYLFETSGGKPYRRAYISEQIAKLSKHAIGRRVSAHKLRHSFVTRQIKEHPDKIPAISVYVGHSSVSTTLAMYNHNELTDADLFGVEATAAWSEAR